MTQTTTETQPGGNTLPVTPLVTPEPAKPWYDGKVDADTTTWLTNRAWHDKPADFVALEAVKAYREASTRFGDLPKPPPADAAGYDLAGVKFSDGVDPTDFKVAFAAKALELKLPQETAAALAAFHVAEVERAATAETTADRISAQTAVDRLRANWGANEAEFRMLAARGLAASGLDAEAVAGLEQAAGYDKTMDLMRRLGQMASEGRFVGAEPGTGRSMVMSATEAETEKARLLHDGVKIDDTPAGTAKLKKLTELDTIIVTARAGHLRGMPEGMLDYGLTR